jgi:hypothetical protein
MAHVHQLPDDLDSFFNASDCFIREDTPVPVYGVIVDDSTSGEAPPEDPDDIIEWEAEQEDLRAESADSKSRGYLFGKCYSQMCSNGELGYTHVSRVSKITRVEFEEAQKKGW